MRKVPYLEWENIFLDTTVLFTYLQALRDTNTDDRCVFVKRVIDDLSNTKSSNNKVRKFHISAITVSEMINHNKGNENRVRKVIDAMNIGTMTIWPFDQDIAEFMIENYHPILGKRKLTDFSKKLSIDASSNDMNIVREWMTKDLMITGTSHYANCDVVLSLDKRTFLPLADEVGYYCAVVDKNNFNYSDKYIFEYQFNFGGNGTSSNLSTPIETKEQQ